MKCPIILIIILILLCIYFFYIKSIERFVDYETSRNYFYCKYNRDNAACNQYQLRKNTLYDMIKLVGYVTNVDTKKKHKLYSYYNTDYRKHNYIIGLSNKEHVSNNNNDLKIELPSNQTEIFTNDIIQIPTVKGNFKVFIYDKDHEILNYSHIPWEESGYIINNKNEYYTIYKKSLNRFDNIYGIYDKNNILIILDIKEKQLYDSDIINIPTLNNQQFNYYNYKL